MNTGGAVRQSGQAGPRRTGGCNNMVTGKKKAEDRRLSGLINRKATVAEKGFPRQDRVIMRG